MAAETGLRNPYIAGRALGQQQGFFGREDILRLVETTLITTDQNALVLFGQRRIGKTSILLQLQHRLPSPPFLPVYFDLMDRARRPLGQVLFDLASAIAVEAGIAPAAPELFDDEGVYFRQQFLPLLYETLGDDRRPILLLDEFDVLDIAAEEQLSPTAAARAFFPYLRKLMQGEPKLGFVFVVGRRAEDLFIEFKATFKASLSQRVSVLDETSGRVLIATAQRQGSLTFDASAIDRILALTAGHPYLTQLVCQILWNDAYAADPHDVPHIDVAAVEAASTKALDAGQNIFEWIWDGLPPAEQVIFAAIAEATNEGSVVTEDELLDLLQRQGIRILTKELEVAPDTLVEWEMLCRIDKGYGFFIELMRRWVNLRKPLSKVKEWLDRIVPLADALYRNADSFYRQADPENAKDLLQKALRVNPNHLKARLLLGQILLEQDRLEDAIRELEEAYRYDEEAAFYPLIRALLVRGEQLGRLSGPSSSKQSIGRPKQADDALRVYERVLEISPHEKVAEERIAAIWIKRGEDAENAGDLAGAMEAYLKAKSPEKVTEIETLQQKIALEKAITVAQNYERHGEWGKALKAYRQLADQNPTAAEWAEAIERTLKPLIAEAQKCEQRGAWDKAIELYQQVVEQEPEHEHIRWSDATASIRPQQLVEQERDNLRWRKSLERAKAEQELQRKYVEGLRAFKQRNWSHATRILTEIILAHPDYKDAAEVLAHSVRSHRLKRLPFRLILAAYMKMITSILIFAGLLYYLASIKDLPFELWAAGWVKTESVLSFLRPFTTSEFIIGLSVILFVLGLILSLQEGFLLCIHVIKSRIGIRGIEPSADTSKLTIDVDETNSSLRT
jgi:tetratricopeptide (TPR) repeat protein